MVLIEIWLNCVVPYIHNVISIFMSSNKCSSSYLQRISQGFHITTKWILCFSIYYKHENLLWKHCNINTYGPCLCLCILCYPILHLGSWQKDIAIISQSCKISICRVHKLGPRSRNHVYIHVLFHIKHGKG